MTGRSRANGEGSIFPYRNGYAAYSWVQTPDGLRKKKWVYGKTREEVHAKWIKLQEDAARGPVATKTPSVGEYLDYWQREIVAPNLAPKTVDNYERFARLYIRPYLGSKNLARLSSRDVQTWANQLAQICQCCTQGRDAARDEKIRRCCALGKCCRRRLSVRTLRDVRDCLRAALNCAVDDELITRNVVKLVRLPAVRKKKGRRWTSEQARRFLTSAREDHDPYYAAYVLILVEGLRKGEVLGMTVDAPDFGRLTVRIEHQLQRVGRELLHRETKTAGSDADLPLPTVVATALRQRLLDRARDEAAAADSWQGSPLLFTTRYGTPIEPRNFDRSWHTRITRAGVPRITVHDGRRTCGSLLADLDVHPRVAMAILRHAQFEITMEIYTEVSDEATRAGLKKLGDSLA
jgi:integrase